MAIFKQVLIIFIIAIISLAVYNFIKGFILTKLKPNKWVTLVLAVLVFFTPVFLPQVYQSFVGTAIFFVLITILALTYVDIVKIEKAKKNRPVVGKPKAKPNRANKNSN